MLLVAAVLVLVRHVLDPRYHTKPLPVPDQEREKDHLGVTSIDFLQNATCMHETPLRLNWLPKRSAMGRKRSPSRVQPFLILHEMHVGEGWLSHMLRANGVAVYTRPAAKSGSVRDSARRWLQAIDKASLAPVSAPATAPISPRVANGNATPGTSNAKIVALGLALTPSTLRILNTGVGAPPLSAEHPPPRALRIVTLARRNRVKHAVSTLSRTLRQPKPSQLRLAAQPVQPEANADVSHEDLIRSLDEGAQQYRRLKCTLQELTARYEHISGEVSHPVRQCTRCRRRRHLRRLRQVQVSSPHHADGSHVRSAAHTSKVPPLPPRPAPLPSAQPLRLDVYYEDLLYDTVGTLQRILDFVRGPSGHDGSAAAATTDGASSGLAIALASKHAPNSLCVRLRNFDETCTRLLGTAWAADLPLTSFDGRSADGFVQQLHHRFSESALARCQQACGRGGRHLVLGASHHKTGTVLLERLLSAYAAATQMSFHKPAWERCPSMQRKEAGVCVDEHTTGAKLRRLFLGPLGVGRYLGAPLIHAVREPLEACVSAYQYHLHSTEAWLKQPRSAAAGALLGLSPPLARLPWQELLHRLDLREGATVECRRSIQDQISQQADAFNATKGNAGVLTLRMEDTQGNRYEATMRLLFSFLIGARAHWPGGQRRQADGELASLVTESARFDLSRHRTDNDDGHLSSLHQKRLLRGILLNQSSLSRELDGWRAAVGYDRYFSTHCSRYNLPYYEQAVEDGFIHAEYERRRRASP